MTRKKNNLKVTIVNLKWKATSNATCPSCIALHEQIHSEEAWREAGLEPGCDKLYCKDNCHCTMEETDEEESGDLNSVPLRRENSIGEPMKKRPLPQLRSMPIVERLKIPPRAEILPKIESGELEHLDFIARVYGTGTNKNPYVFKDEDLETFAASFEGQPFLRNHDTYDIEARDGTILESILEGSAFKQTIRLTTRRGMTDFVEGKIDRFSIGWFYDDVICSICNSSWFECWSHSPGRSYKTDGGMKKCELIFINPKGKETSAVNTPAVEGTEIVSQLQEYKLEVSGDSDRRNPRVINPATGGAPRVHSTLLKGANMKKKVTAQADVLPEEEQSEEERAALELMGANQTIEELRAQQAESNAILVAQCESLLDSALAASKLPAASQKAIRKPFDALLAEGKPFKATQLQEAIKEKREELAALNEGASIQGPARSGGFSGMMTGIDQFRAAVYDLLGAEREEADKNLRVRRLSGIREAYLLATGDQDFHGGYYPEFSLVTANFPGIVANVQNKILTQAWKDFEEHYGWWKKITTVEHFNNLNDVTWIRTGTIASLPSVQERGEYTELPIGDAKETSSWGKYGGYVPLTIEAILRDDVRAFSRMPREVALAGIRNISEQIAAIFTVNSGAGPTMSDGGALFNATAQTTAGGHANLLTTALGTDYTAWKAVALAMFKKKLMVKNATGYYGTGKPQALYPTIALVPPDLADQANALFVPRWEAPAQNVPATQSVLWGGRVDPVTVPEWTDATDWAAVIDPKLRPGVMLGEIFGIKPQIFSASSETDPAMFANDESRIKVRHFITVGVADDMPLHKSNVAG